MVSTNKENQTRALIALAGLILVTKIYQKRQQIQAQRALINKRSTSANIGVLSPPTAQVFNSTTTVPLTDAPVNTTTPQLSAEQLFGLLRQELGIASNVNFPASVQSNVALFIGASNPTITVMADGHTSAAKSMGDSFIDQTNDEEVKAVSLAQAVTALKEAMVQSKLIGDTGFAQLIVDSRTNHWDSASAATLGDTGLSTFSDVWGTKTLQQAVTELGIMAQSNNHTTNLMSDPLVNQLHSNYIYFEDVLSNSGNTGATGSGDTGYANVFGDKTQTEAITMMASLLQRQGLLAGDMTDVPVTNNAFRMLVDGETAFNTFSSSTFEGYSLQQSVVALQLVLNKMGLMGDILKNQDLQTRTYYKQTLTADYNGNTAQFGNTATVQSFAQVFGAHKTLPQALADVGTILSQQNLYLGDMSQALSGDTAMLFDSRVKLDVFEGATGSTGSGDTAYETTFAAEFPDMQLNQALAVLSRTLKSQGLLVEDMSNVDVVTGTNLNTDGVFSVRHFGESFEGLSLQQALVKIWMILNAQGLVNQGDQSMSELDIQTRTYWKDSVTAFYNGDTATYGPTASISSYVDVFGTDKSLPQALAAVGTILQKQNVYLGDLSDALSGDTGMLFDSRVKIDQFDGATGSTGAGNTAYETTFAAEFPDMQLNQAIAVLARTLKSQGLLVEDMSNVDVVTGTNLNTDGAFSVRHFGESFEGLSLQQAMVKMWMILNAQGLVNQGNQSISQLDIQTRTYWQETTAPFYNGDTATYGPTASISSYVDVFGADKSLPQALAALGVILEKQNLYIGSLSDALSGDTGMRFDGRVKIDVFEGATGDADEGDTAYETNYVAEFPGMQINQAVAALARTLKEQGLLVQDMSNVDVVTGTNLNTDGAFSVRHFGESFEGLSLQQAIVKIWMILNAQGLVNQGNQSISQLDVQTRTYWQETTAPFYNGDTATYGPTASISSYVDVFGADKSLPQALAALGVILEKQNLYIGSLSDALSGDTGMRFDDRVKIDVFEGATSTTGEGDTAYETNFVAEFPGMQINQAVAALARTLKEQGLLVQDMSNVDVVTGATVVQDGSPVTKHFREIFSDLSLQQAVVKMWLTLEAQGIASSGSAPSVDTTFLIVENSNPAAFGVSGPTYYSNKISNILGTADYDFIGRFGDFTSTPNVTLPSVIGVLKTLADDLGLRYRSNGDTAATPESKTTLRYVTVEQAKVGAPSFDYGATAYRNAINATGKASKYANLAQLFGLGGADEFNYYVVCRDRLYENSSLVTMDARLFDGTTMKTNAGPVRSFMKTMMELSKFRDDLQDSDLFDIKEELTSIENQLGLTSSSAKSNFFKQNIRALTYNADGSLVRTNEVDVVSGATGTFYSTGATANEQSIMQNLVTLNQAPKHHVYRLGTLNAWSGNYTLSELGLSQYNLNRRYSGIVNSNYTTSMYTSLAALMNDNTAVESDFFLFFVQNGLPPSFTFTSSSASYDLPTIAASAYQRLSQLNQNDYAVKLRAGWSHKLSFVFSFDMTNSFLETAPTQVILDRGVVVNGVTTWTYGVELVETLLQNDVQQVVLTDVVDLRQTTGVDRDYVYKIRAITVRDIPSIGTNSSISSINNISNEIVSRTLHMIDRFGQSLFPYPIDSHVNIDVDTGSTGYMIVPIYVTAPDYELFASNHTGGLIFDTTQQLTLLNETTIPGPSGPAGFVYYDSLTSLSFANKLYMFFGKDVAGAVAPSNVQWMVTDGSNGKFYVDVPLMVYRGINNAKYNITPQPYVLPNGKQVFARIYSLQEYVRSGSSPNYTYALRMNGSKPYADNLIIWEMLRRTLANVLRGNNKNVVLDLIELDSYVNRNSMNTTWTSTQASIIVPNVNSTSIMGAVSGTYAMPDSFLQSNDNSLNQTDLEGNTIDSNFFNTTSVSLIYLYFASQSLRATGRNIGSTGTRKYYMKFTDANGDLQLIEVFEEPVYPWTPVYASVESLIAVNPSISVDFDTAPRIPATIEEGVITAVIGGQPTVVQNAIPPTAVFNASRNLLSIAGANGANYLFPASNVAAQLSSNAFNGNNQPVYVVFDSASSQYRFYTVLYADRTKSELLKARQIATVSSVTASTVLPTLVSDVSISIGSDFDAWFDNGDQAFKMNLSGTAVTLSTRVPNVAFANNNVLFDWQVVNRAWTSALVQGQNKLVVLEVPLGANQYKYVAPLLDTTGSYIGRVILASSTQASWTGDALITATHTGSPLMSTLSLDAQSITYNSGTQTWTVGGVTATVLGKVTPTTIYTMTAAGVTSDGFMTTSANKTLSFTIAPSQVRSIGVNNVKAIITTLSKPNGSTLSIGTVSDVANGADITGAFNLGTSETLTTTKTFQADTLGAYSFKVEMVNQDGSSFDPKVERTVTVTLLDVQARSVSQEDLVSLPDYFEFPAVTGGNFSYPTPNSNINDFINSAASQSNSNKNILLGHESNTLTYNVQGDFSDSTIYRFLGINSDRSKTILRLFNPSNSSVTSLNLHNGSITLMFENLTLRQDGLFTTGFMFSTHNNNHKLYFKNCIIETNQQCIIKDRSQNWSYQNSNYSFENCDIKFLAYTQTFGDLTHRYIIRGEGSSNDETDDNSYSMRLPQCRIKDCTINVQQTHATISQQVVLLRYRLNDTNPYQHFLILDNISMHPNSLVPHVRHICEIDNQQFAAEINRNRNFFIYMRNVNLKTSRSPIRIRKNYKIYKNIFVQNCSLLPADNQTQYPFITVTDPNHDISYFNQDQIISFTGKDYPLFGNFVTGQSPRSVSYTDGTLEQVKYIAGTTTTVSTYQNILPRIRMVTDTTIYQISTLVVPQTVDFVKTNELNNITFTISPEYSRTNGITGAKLKINNITGGSISIDGNTVSNGDTIHTFDIGQTETVNITKSIIYGSSGQYVYNVLITDSEDNSIVNQSNISTFVFGTDPEARAVASEPIVSLPTFQAFDETGLTEVSPAPGLINISSYSGNQVNLSAGTYTVTGDGDGWTTGAITTGVASSRNVYIGSSTPGETIINLDATQILSNQAQKTFFKNITFDALNSSLNAVINTQQTNNGQLYFENCVFNTSRRNVIGMEWWVSVVSQPGHAHHISLQGCTFNFVDNLVSENFVFASRDNMISNWFDWSFVQVHDCVINPNKPTTFSRGNYTNSQTNANPNVYTSINNLTIGNSAPVQSLKSLIRGDGSGSLTLAYRKLFVYNSTLRFSNPPIDFQEHYYIKYWENIYVHNSKLLNITSLTEQTPFMQTRFLAGAYNIITQNFARNQQQNIWFTGIDYAKFSNQSTTIIHSMAREVDGTRMATPHYVSTRDNITQANLDTVVEGVSLLQTFPTIRFGPEV